MSPESEIILDIKNLSVDIRSIQNQKLLLDNVSFSVRKDSILGITGESGSGKSMTAKSIMKILDEKNDFLVDGQLFYKGKDLNQCNDQELNKIRGKEIAIVFQQPESIFNPIMRCGKQIFEAIQIHQRLSNIDIKKKVNTLLQSVGLEDTNRIYHSYPHQLSGGQLQRVAIAMAICNDPSIIIADEATSSLDENLKKGIIDLLLNIKKQTHCAIIFITHDLKLLTQISESILMIKDGKVVDCYKVNDVNAMVSDYTTSYLKNSIENTEYRKYESQETYLALEFSHVYKSYDRYRLYPFFKESNQALRDVSFQLHTGMLLGVLGASGSGKSTIAKILVGLEGANAGNILINEVNISSNHLKNKKSIAKSIQMVFQDAATSLNPTHNIRYILNEVLNTFYNFSKQEKEKTIEELFEKMSLSMDVLDRYAKELSGGQKQRICLARVLLIQPSIIVFDESLSALDVVNQKKMMDLILDLHKIYGFSAIFISHDPLLIKYLCSHVIKMEKGKIIQSGRVEDVLLHTK